MPGFGTTRVPGLKKGRTPTLNANFFGAGAPGLLHITNQPLEMEIKEPNHGIDIHNSPASITTVQTI